MITPNIKTISPDESKAFYQLIDRNRDRLVRYFPMTMSEITDEQSAKVHLEDSIEQMKRRELFPFGIYSGEQLAGWICVKNIDWRSAKAELGYYVDRDYEGNGLMSFAVKYVINYSFKLLELKKIFLRVGFDNIGSQRIAQKNGFIKEGVLRKEFKVETGEVIDLIYYGLLKEDDIS